MISGWLDRSVVVVVLVDFQICFGYQKGSSSSLTD
jgi:hypothetical protein